MKHLAPRPTHRRPLAVAAVAVLLSGAVLPASAVAATPRSADTGDSGDVRVVNTETVQVYLDAAGKQEAARIYEQLTLTGKGSVTVDNPVAGSTRNLDGFGGPAVRDDVQVVEADVDGEDRFRTVTPWNESLPLEVEATYTLDGERVEPGDVVGRSGRLQVEFHVVNRTAQKQQVEVADGKGGTTTETMDVAIPMVGSLTTTAPASFRNVSSDQANVAGDGKGGTKLSFTMTLFAPVGAPETTFGYAADIEDGVVPRVDISALPVDPLQSPTFASAAESYQGGADTGARLADGASTIDTNLLKLRDGSQDLLAGLIQLRDGADQLNDGLEAKAVPGSRKLADGTGTLVAGLTRLADGAGTLAAGTGKLDAGAGTLAAGTKKLDDGAGAAAAGGKKLSAGLQQLSGGLGKLKDVQGLPAVAGGIDQLKVGVDQLVAGFGAAGQPKTLVGGLTALDTGLGVAAPKTQEAAVGARSLASGLPQAKGGVDQVKAGLDDSLKPGGGLDQLVGGLTLLDTAHCATAVQPQVCSGIVANLRAGVADSRTKLATASGGLGQISGRLGTAAVGADQIASGLELLAPSLAGAKAGTADLLAGAQRAKAGTQQVRAGLDALGAGLAKAIDGVLQLSTGADAAYAGSQDLSSGLGDLADGTGRLRAGAGELAAGTGKLDDGAGQLADGAGDAQDGAGLIDDGAQQLADGLGDAGDGSARLAEGLGTAAAKAPALPQGAQRLSEEGTTKLVEAGETTAAEYSEKVAVMKAGAERAHTEGMAVGAPEGAVGRTAYSYVLQGEDGEGRRNALRAGGGALAVAAAGGMFWWRRRGLL